MKRSILVTTLIGVAAALALAWYFGSPYWTLKQMADAVAANDTDRLATYVDFAALKDSMKNEVKANAAKELMKGEQNGLGALGAAIGVAMADGMIDAFVTPEMLRAMLAGKAGGKSKLGSFDLAATDTEVVRDGLSQFRLRKADGDALVFQRRGLGWQLVSIRSQDEVDEPANEGAPPAPALVQDELAVASVPAEADQVAGETSEPEYSSQYQACMSSGDAADGVTSGMMDCIGGETDRQGAELNRTYKAVMANLEPEEATALRQRQRNWIKLRDATCQEAAADEEGGTLGQVIFSQCILAETAKRVDFLRAYSD